MKILIAALSVTGKAEIRTGVERFFGSISPFLKKKGYTLVLYEDDRPVDVDILALRPTSRSLFSEMFTRKFARFFQKTQPQAVHIPIELGIGFAARHFCLQQGLPFTSGFHTNLAFGLNTWYHVPEKWTWNYLRWFHAPAKNVHVFSPRMQLWLENHGFTQPIKITTPGVDPRLFYYDPTFTLSDQHPRPYFIYAGRIAKEKNLEAFLSLNLPGTKILVGNGPIKSHLMKKYKEALFFPSENLRPLLSMSDVFVFPSRFDTFGIVQLEALACGLPIAAFPVMGPLDVIQQGINGFALDNLQEAALKCLHLKKDLCIKSAEPFSWEITAQGFLENQVFF